MLWPPSVTSVLKETMSSGMESDYTVSIHFGSSLLPEATRASYYVLGQIRPPNFQHKMYNFNRETAYIITITEEGRKVAAHQEIIWLQIKLRVCHNYSGLQKRTCSNLRLPSTKDPPHHLSLVKTMKITPNREMEKTRPPSDSRGEFKRLRRLRFLVNCHCRSRTLLCCC